ncbi:ATP-binding protein [Actinomyces howellii]|uniref:histidine kinase n=1 Tax=Actinomyces howellii TaxID=52771 RepID=A0A3S5EH33_9ACTO|nr:ATP-binding protein [Actinomyces howellii]VEG28680.1 Sensor protein ZraS [Actinomyces howellii]
MTAEPANEPAPEPANEPAPERLAVAVVSPASLGSQAAHEIGPAVAAVADVVRLRSLAELLARAAGAGDAPLPTVPLIVATDEVGSLDDVAAAVDRYPSLATARLVLLTERTELSNLGRAIDEDLVREVVAVPWTPGAIADRAAAQTRRWMRDHRPQDERSHELGVDHGAPDPGRSPLLEALGHSADVLTAELIAACEAVLGPRPRLRLPPGVRLTHQGQIVDSVCIVVSGAVALTRHTRVGEVVLHHATTGRVIGLVSLAGHGRAYVTATTTTEVELILLSIEQLDRSLRENPATEQTLAALLIGSLTTRLSRSEVLQVEKTELAAAVAAEKAQAQEALEALEQARLELLAQERFATLGELAAGVAHELNNPVAALERAGAHLSEDIASILLTHPDGPAIRAAAEAARTRPAASTRTERAARRSLEAVLGDRETARRLVALGYGPDSDPAEVRALAADPLRLRTTEAAASIGRGERNIGLATARISGLVAALSTYVRPEGEQPVDVDPREVLEDALRLTAHRLRGVEIERDYAEVPRIPARGGELAQVWTNILANAADALAAQAKAAADAGQEPPHARVVLRATPAPEAVRIQVEDNGPGIPDDVLPRIFEPRFTTKHGQVRFGLGLGMGLAKSVVDAHGGTISVDSRPGRTCVTVDLPTHPALTAPTPQEAP